MSLFEKRAKAMENRDAETLIACLHDDYEFVRHQTGTSMNKTEMSEMLRSFMTAEGIVAKEFRCLYENDEVLVEHSLMDFPDGSTESIISFNAIKDEKLIRTETGATLISK